MSQTSAFVALKVRVKQLEFLLPHSVPINKQEEQQHQDSTRAFLLLCHAEVETFVEELAKKLGECLAREFLNPTAGATFSRRHAAETCRRYPNLIHENHGIKESNLLSMFGLFGITENTFIKIYPDFLSEFNSYGTLRGASAHRSASRIEQQLNIRSQKIKIQKILDLLELLEIEVNRICLHGILK